MNVQVTTPIVGFESNQSQSIATGGISVPASYYLGAPATYVRKPSDMSPAKLEYDALVRAKASEMEVSELDADKY